MTHLTFGIIGCGNMGGAIAHGILASEALKKSFRVSAYDITENAKKQLEKAGATWFTTPTALATECDLVLLAVKPYQTLDLIEKIRPCLASNKTVLSIAAGQPLCALMSALGGACSAVQIMPNTPTVIGDGIFGLCFDDPTLTQERKTAVQTLFEKLGTVFVLPESKMNALMAVTGAGPAYVFTMMDAVMEAAVTLGFTRQEASTMVAALFRGSARMVDETGLHPGVLHSQVTSPKGATIIGTNHLARTAVRGHIIDAILAVEARGREMEKE